MISASTKLSPRRIVYRPTARTLRLSGEGRVRLAQGQSLRLGILYIMRASSKMNALIAGRVRVVHIASLPRIH